MTTIIGLKSGKEFIVKDELVNTVDPTNGELIHYATSLDNNRVIVIKNLDVEFFDLSKDVVEKVRKEYVKVEPEVKEYDPNYL